MPAALASNSPRSNIEAKIACHQGILFPTSGKDLNVHVIFFVFGGMVC